MCIVTCIEVEVSCMFLHVLEGTIRECFNRGYMKYKNTGCKFRNILLWSIQHDRNKK